ncbi:MAG: hypothetical protein HYV96_21290 [Opitutae bacterium]|nr:hypothetical protein [Opitutae bacterium]
MDWLELIPEFRDGAFLIVGALIGYLASVAMWRRQLAEERRRRTEDHVVRAISLCVASLTYARAIIFAKKSGDIASLPENPVDELMAIVGLHFHEANPLVQKLHEKQQGLFAYPASNADAAERMLEIAREMPPIVNQLSKQLGAIPDRFPRA